MQAGSVQSSTFRLQSASKVCRSDLAQQGFTDVALHSASDDVSTAATGSQFTQRSCCPERTRSLPLPVLTSLFSLGAEIISEVKLQSALLDFSMHVFDEGLDRSAAGLHFEREGELRNRQDLERV
ncbi:MAG: hypothetical protein QOH71_1356 [Blastocatellia bacterium]|nr:hypothetical protein [Blastocatellia bacterium]